MSEKPVFVSKRRALRKRKVYRARTILGFIVFVLLVSLFFWVAHMKKLLVTNVTVSGEQVISADEVKEKVMGMIQGSYLFGAIPKNNVLWYPKQKIKTVLFATYPRLGSVGVDRDGETITVHLIERIPKFLWCGALEPTTSEEAFSRECYFVDARGYIFAMAPTFSDTVFMKIYAPLLTSDPVGTAILNSDILSHSDMLRAGIKSLGYEPYALVPTTDGDIKILLHRNTLPSPYVFYNPAHDPAERLSDLKIGLASEPLKTKVKTEFSLLDYIDVRFARKVFYKFSDESKQEQPNEGSTEVGTEILGATH